MTDNEQGQETWRIQQRARLARMGILELEALDNELTHLKEENEALRQFVRHEPGCMGDIRPRECSCPLGALLTATQQGKS